MVINTLFPKVIQKVRSLLSDAQALQNSMTTLKVFLNYVPGYPDSPETGGPNAPKIEDWLEACVPWLKAIRDFIALLEAGLPSTTAEAESHPGDESEPGGDDEDEEEVDEYLRGEDHSHPRKRVKTRSMSDEDREFSECAHYRGFSFTY